MDAVECTRIVRECAADAGFNRVGIAAAGPHPHGDDLRRWLADGRAGTMSYMHRHVESRIDVRAWLPNATHVIVVTLNYRQPDASDESLEKPEAPAKVAGRVAQYARGEDYHVVMRDKMDAMIAGMRARFTQQFFARACVDTSAITERELAAAAGIGWIGKNTLVLNEHYGSFFFIGVILTDLPLIPDPPVTDHCGTCTRCLDACPTAAFPTPYEMDASRCISYLTIEHRGDIDPALAAKMGDWLFGCDVCQDVCPFNRKAPIATEPRLRERPAVQDRAEDSSPRASRRGDPALIDGYLDASKVADWTDGECRTFTRGKALSRAKPEMWRRNALIVLKNGEAARVQSEVIEP